MRRRKTLISRAILVITLLLLAGGLISCPEKGVPPGQIVEVKRGNLIVTVNVDGNLSMPRQAKLAFDTPGTIQKIKVKEGDKVTKGQLLAKLDTSSLELAIKMAETDLEIAEYTLMETAGLTPPGWAKVRPDYTSAYGTNIPGAQFLLKEIDELLIEIKELLDDGKISQAQSQLKLVQEKLTQAQYKLGGKWFAYPLSVRLAELRLDKAKMALDKAKIELQKAFIFAPYDGIVAKIGAKEGDRLSAFNYATTIVVHLIDPNLMEMKAFIDEIDVPKVKSGQEVIITVDALPDVELNGKVTFISLASVIRAGVVSYEAILSLQHSGNPELRDGMTATAKFIIDCRENVLLVPNKAIKGAPGNYWVKTIKNGRIEPRIVTLGISDGKNTEVLAGLSEGERVIIEAITK